MLSLFLVPVVAVGFDGQQHFLKMPRVLRDSPAISSDFGQNWKHHSQHGVHAVQAWIMVHQKQLFLHQKQYSPAHRRDFKLKLVTFNLIFNNTMGATCASRRKPRNTVDSQKASTSKQSLEYCDSQSLASYMRTKPPRKFLTDLIAQHQIQVDSIDQLKAKISGKSELIIRSYTEHTSAALKIKQAVLEFCDNDFGVLIKYHSESAQTKPSTENSQIQEAIQYQTLLLLLEVTIILNCLMDVNFDDENEFWWTEEYFQERLAQFPALDDFPSENKLVRPLLRVIQGLRLKLREGLPVQVPLNPIATSTALQNDHLTKFYQGMKLDFIRPVEEEVIKEK